MFISRLSTKLTAMIDISFLIHLGYFLLLTSLDSFKVFLKTMETNPISNIDFQRLKFSPLNLTMILQLIPFYTQRLEVFPLNIQIKFLINFYAFNDFISLNQPFLNKWAILDPNVFFHLNPFKWVFFSVFSTSIHLNHVFMILNMFMYIIPFKLGFFSLKCIFEHWVHSNHAFFCKNMFCKFKPLKCYHTLDPLKFDIFEVKWTLFLINMPLHLL